MSEQAIATRLVKSFEAMNLELEPSLINSLLIGMKVGNRGCVAKGGTGDYSIMVFTDGSCLNYSKGEFLIGYDGDHQTMLTIKLEEE